MNVDGEPRARATFAMWCALCEAAGELLEEHCAHDDVAYVTGSPLARWLLRRFSR